MTFQGFFLVMSILFYREPAKSFDDTLYQCPKNLKIEFRHIFEISLMFDFACYDFFFGRSLFPEKE